MDESEIYGAAANSATAAYTTNPLEIARDALQDGAAADAAAVPNITNSTKIAQDALLSSINKCQELSCEVDLWINYVLESASRGIPLLKKSAKAGARAFTALEHLLSEVYKLLDRWKVVNTVPENELEELPEEAPIYNLATAR